MLEIDLDKMTLDEVLEYCDSREKWLLNLFIECEGLDNAFIILAENDKI